MESDHGLEQASLRLRLQMLKLRLKVATAAKGLSARIKEHERSTLCPTSAERGFATQHSLGQVAGKCPPEVDDGWQSDAMSDSSTRPSSFQAPGLTPCIAMHLGCASLEADAPATTSAQYYVHGLDSAGCLRHESLAEEGPWSVMTHPEEYYVRDLHIGISHLLRIAQKFHLLHAKQAEAHLNETPGRLRRS